MLTDGGDAEREALLEVGRLMCLAARTAPKGGGVDNIVTALVAGEEKQAIVAELQRIAAAQSMQAYSLNAKDVEASELVVLIGTRLKRYRVKTCDFCGFADCDANAAANGICAMAVGDLGIAVGSAASVAGRHHADNRIMFTVGKAALNLRLLDERVKICYGIPLSARGKNPYFDKDWKRVYGVVGWEAR